MRQKMGILSWVLLACSLFAADSLIESAGAFFCKSNSPTTHTIDGAATFTQGQCTLGARNMTWGWSAVWGITNTNDPSHQCCAYAWHGVEVYKKDSMNNESQIIGNMSGASWDQTWSTIMCGTTWTKNTQTYTTMGCECQTGMGYSYKGFDYAAYGDPDSNNHPMSGNWDKKDTGYVSLP
jgi:hypothetical protein